MCKIKLEPINIDAKLKNFMSTVKEKLKSKYNKTYFERDALLYYLKDSNKFNKDYETYCKNILISTKNGEDGENIW